MRNTLNTITSRIIKDLRRNATFIIIVAVLWGILNLLFHRFCPVVLICGYPCPGCGITRAFWAFVTLHPVKALHYNPVYPLWLAFLLAAFWTRYVRGKSLKGLYYPLLFTGVLTILVYIYRMIFMFPGDEPMVYVHDNLFSIIRSFF
ncbi:DUF2752 domain-containing protein [Butyrivibrio proteoclasticus]|uniref:DUF2752 domain-containing protein n=1 Tax=Butyrivibrio proteoclasticus TaxID=43305 RepID=UPI000311D863|nr:DUF2752 domain-containing protein [Butyrivibrio proteoclasticus]